MDEQAVPRTMNEALLRIAELESCVSRLRHDVRGILSPALLRADMIRGHADPRVAKAGEAVVAMVQRVSARLQETCADVASRGPASPGEAGQPGPANRAA